MESGGCYLNGSRKSIKSSENPSVLLLMESDGILNGFKKPLPLFC